MSEEDDKITNSQEKKEENEDDEQNFDNKGFMPLLTDLFNQINIQNDDEEIDEKDEEKSNNNMILEEGDKESNPEEYADEDLINEENELDINYNVFKNEPKKDDKINNTQNNFINHDNDKTRETESTPRVLSQPLFHPKNNNIGRNSSDLMIINSNSIQNNLNYYNSSFSKNGKLGWVCPACHNFNYECKFFLYKLNFFIIF